MRTTVLIVGGNVLAFALGAVTTVWVLALGLPTPPAPRVTTLASLEKPPTPATEPAPDSTPQMPATADPSATETALPQTAPQAAPPPAAAPPTAVAPPPAVALPPAVAIADPAPPAAAPSAPPPAPAPAPAPPVVFAPVAPAPPPPPPPPAGSASTAAAPATAGYVLQLGAFQEPANAARLQAAIRKAGYPADVVPAKSGGKTWQLVRIGGYASREAAAAAAASLQRDTGVAALIMKPPLP